MTPATLAKLRALCETWPNENGDPPEGAYQNGYMSCCQDCASELRAILDGAGEGDGWRPIETAPKSIAVGSHVSGVYLLGFCPDEAVDPKSCMSVIWWEPLTNGGAWYGQEAIEVRPTHWRPLPPPPGAPR